ncbi:MAG: recombination protein RecR [Candidatus Moranbacteria bacterium]|nr:recombination protein RecR [Candidatus Moranbacteria bacterium]
MHPKPFQELIKHFSSLPSIGPKMAERLTLYLFKQSPEDIKSFALSLEALTKLSFCKRCFNVSDQEHCSLCRDTQRDQTIICVVEDALDAIAIERSSFFHGTYHILGGTLEIGKNGETNEPSLTIEKLLHRISEEKTQEILLATNPTTEGDLTALYIKRKLHIFPSLRISRIAKGLATGGDIEYADEQTLIGALKNRRYYDASV